MSAKYRDDEVMFIRLTPTKDGGPFILAIDLITRVSASDETKPDGPAKVSVSRWPGYSNGTSLEVREPAASIERCLERAGYEILKPGEELSNPDVGMVLE